MGGTELDDKNFRRQLTNTENTNAITYTYKFTFLST